MIPFLGQSNNYKDERSKKRVGTIHFESEAKKGVISSYMILDHEGLVKSIDELETEISTW
ncbi:CMF_collapsed_G0013330.mRNA.1.CDS.1 [Saccharomyces cerevisiae]|nr:CMF_collapsed_G0013330.mRNA.1.CDS.1 [Saccharomyces cerevisiae]